MDLIEDRENAIQELGKMLALQNVYLSSVARKRWKASEKAMAAAQYRAHMRALNVAIRTLERTLHIPGGPDPKPSADAPRCASTEKQ